MQFTLLQCTLCTTIYYVKILASAETNMNNFEILPMFEPMFVKVNEGNISNKLIRYYQKWI